MSMHFNPSVKLVVKLILAFLFLSLADLFLTWKLVHGSGGQVLESNPVAGWWLATYGWGGMTAFKLGMMLFIGMLAGGIACLRPRTSELILVFACGAQSSVVLYSVFLTQFVEGREADPAIDFAWELGEGLEVDPGSGFPRFYGPYAVPDNGLLRLLSQESVQRELRLSEAQVQEVTRLADKLRALGQGPRGGKREERDAAFQQLLAEEKTLLDGLKSEQRERLYQMARQQRGPGYPRPGGGRGPLANPRTAADYPRSGEGADKARATPSDVRRYGSDVAR